MARPREGAPISINLPKNALTQIRVGYPSLQPEKRRFLGPHNVRNNGSYDYWRGPGVTPENWQLSDLQGSIYGAASNPSSKKRTYKSVHIIW